MYTLFSFLCSVKLAIWLKCKNQIQGAGCVEPVSVLEGLVKARLRVEHSYYRMTDNVADLLTSGLLGGGSVLCG